MKAVKKKTKRMKKLVFSIIRVEDVEDTNINNESIMINEHIFK